MNAASAPAEWGADATNGAGFDYVYNTPGEPSIDASVLAVKDFGTILDILGHFPTQPGFQAKWLTFKSVFAGRPIVSGDRAEEVGEILTATADMVAGGDFRPLVDERQFTFDSIGDAHQTAEHGSPTGKVVVTNSWT